MSGIVLSASVRQNLLSLQSTADLLSRTQDRLSTGNKVNTAADGPDAYFTSVALNNRASDISNLLDGLGNGIQVLDAANTGITSLQKLVDTAKSVANQALQATPAYAGHASLVSAAIANNGVAVTASDLRGAGTVTAASVAGSAMNAAAGAPIPVTTSTTLASLGFAAGQIIGIGGYTMDFAQTGGNNIQSFGANFDLSVATVGDLLNAVQTYSTHSMTYSISAGGQITLNGNNFALANFSGTALGLLGLTATASTNAQTGSAVTLPGAPGGSMSSATLLTNLSSAVTTSDTMTVNGKTVSFVNTGGGNVISASGATIDLASATVDNLLTAITTITGGTASIASGAITIDTGTANDLGLTGSALGKLGLATGTTNRVGLTLALGPVGSGTATTITFGDGTNGTVKSLADLNTALDADGLVATLDAAGKLAIQTSHDNPSGTFSTIGGTAASNAAGAFATANGATVSSSPTPDLDALNTRASLVRQYNAVIGQILNTTRDASFNGINLLNGDQLSVVFNETGKSVLSIDGVSDDPDGLGLSTLAAGDDFLDNADTQQVLDRLDTASGKLRQQASAFGAHLSVLQIRQDFSHNLIDVLQTGASALTLADTNEEAASSQALSTRQSIAVSALALANQSQQSVLQLLR